MGQLLLWFIEICRRSSLSAFDWTYIWLYTSPQMPPKRDEAALQEEEELQLAIALSQSEAEEKERMVGCSAEILTCVCFYSSFIKIKADAYPNVQLQRHKGSYSMYPKADPVPVTSSAPPVSTLYTSPVVRLVSNKISYALQNNTFERLFFILLFKLLHFWLLWNTFQNSSAPSAEDVDPEVRVALLKHAQQCYTPLLKLIRELSSRSSWPVTWTEHTGRKNRKRLARVPPPRRLPPWHWPSRFLQSVSLQKVTSLSSLSA